MLWRITNETHWTQRRNGSAAPRLKSLHSLRLVSIVWSSEPRTAGPRCRAKEAAKIWRASARPDAAVTETTLPTNLPRGGP